MGVAFKFKGRKRTFCPDSRPRLCARHSHIAPPFIFTPVGRVRLSLCSNLRMRTLRLREGTQLAQGLSK